MDKLREFATDRQKDYLDAVEKYGSKQKAAEALGINLRTLTRGLSKLRESAAKKGYSPDHNMTHTVPSNYLVKGISTLYGEDGSVKAQWIKSSLEDENFVSTILEVLEDKIKNLPALPKVEDFGEQNEDLLTLYTITDFHYGMFAWGAETGEDWDLEIARKTLIQTFHELMEASPNSEVGILNQLGDFLHWDGLEAVTPSSKHTLDADTRFPKLVEFVLDSCILLVELMLKKHKKVVVYMCEGNHDIASSVWLQKSLKMIFRDNSRVAIDDTAFPYYAYKHGDIMLGFHHGHKTKNKSLPALFASEPRYRKMWGDSKYTYIHTGHYHHVEQDMAEEGGAIVERHPTLAARDAYSARGGYVSYRAARAITYHKETGEDVRITKTPRGY